MTARTWPDDWEDRRNGRDCPFCDHSGDVDPHGNPRFFAGRWADAYLRTEGPAPGYSVVAFRGRHVADLSELTPDEAAGFWADLSTVAGMLTEVFEPCHLNYQFLGNLVPHVHAHVVPRYLDDASPGRPIVWDEREVEPAELARQLARLREAV
jgi:diadenosine tetraphosphate (Ap4A) HIT family hydrolase